MDLQTNKRIYSGIKLAESVRLYKKDGSYNIQIKSALDSFINKLKEKEHELLSEYTHSETKVLIDFNCNHEPHWITPKDYKKGHGCGRCGGRSSIHAKVVQLDLQINKRIYSGIKLAESVRLYKKDGSYNIQIKSALDSFINKLKEKEHELLSEYTNSATKVLIDFNCNHEPHWIIPNDYKQGYGCGRCGGTSSIQAKEDFELLLKQNGHKLLSAYNTAHDHVLINFNCGHEPHSIKPHNYKNGIRCPKCSGHSPEQAKDNFYQEVEKVGYKLLGEYQNSKTKVKMQCTKGHTFYTIPNNFTSNKSNCLKCVGHDPEQALEDLINSMTINGHELLSKYLNTMTKVLIDFKCGHEAHWMMPYVYKQGQRCPLCRESRGERIIRDYLKSNGITYIHQYKFQNNNKTYDFYLPDENTIVEIHGQQHYEEVKIFHHHSYKTFEDEQINDRNKEEFARKMGCRYIVVDYREHNPKLALERFIVLYEQLKESKFK